MTNDCSLTRKLRHGAALSPDDATRLAGISRTALPLAAGTDLVIEGNDAEYVHFIASGTACRYKHLPDGRRAIVALLLPGDFCDLHVGVLGHMDHSIGTLTECEATRVPSAQLDQTLAEHPSINRACIWASLVDEAVLREWLVNVGRRSADQQLAHLFCELFTRLEAVGLTHDNSFRMPFTQLTLGDLLGISPVHVQRTMGHLRDAGHIVLQDKNLRIPDFPALAALGEFDPAYLHLGMRGAQREGP